MKRSSFAHTLSLRLSRRRQRGMTLLEIMIVLAILALVMGLVVGPKVMSLFADSKEKIAKMAVDKYAFEAYGSWAPSNPSKACPDKLEDLNAYMNNKDSKDPWGTQYRMKCGQSLPPSVKGGIAVESAGPDQKWETEDDIKSY
jgi:prepilin-type N-terminal cleavage/methylation domain-containing protein